MQVATSDEGGARCVAGVFCGRCDDRRRVTDPFPGAASAPCYGRCCQRRSAPPGKSSAVVRTPWTPSILPRIAPASARFEVPLVFAGLTVIAAMGVIAYAICGFAETRLTFWAFRSRRG